MSSPRLLKLNEATDILCRCIGVKGVWADPSRYKDQCWTRDLGFAVAPALCKIGEFSIVRKHLENLSAQQRPNGQIPILFLDNEERWVAEKTEKERIRPSFMLKRYREGELWNLTPGTRDSEICYLLAMHEYAMSSGDRQFLKKHEHNIESALDYITKHLLDKHGLALGCDWRDTMHIELGDKPLLTNNCLLYEALKRIESCGGHTPVPSKAMRRNILQVLRSGDGLLLDYPGSTRFDPLGGALAVLFDVAGTRMYRGLIESFRKIDTKHGVTIKCRHNHQTTEELQVIERTDGVVVWPFVLGFVVLALKKMGAHQFASEQLDKLAALEGFREWYDPATGKGYGAQEQLWSATLYIRQFIS